MCTNILLLSYRRAPIQFYFWDNNISLAMMSINVKKANSSLLTKRRQCTSGNTIMSKIIRGVCAIFPTFLFSHFPSEMRLCGQIHESFGCSARISNKQIYFAKIQKKKKIRYKRNVRECYAILHDLSYVPIRFDCIAQNMVIRFHLANADTKKKKKLKHIQNIWFIYLFILLCCCCEPRALMHKVHQWYANQLHNLWIHDQCWLDLTTYGLRTDSERERSFTFYANTFAQYAQIIVINNFVCVVTPPFECTHIRKQAQIRNYDMIAQRQRKKNKKNKQNSLDYLFPIHFTIYIYTVSFSHILAFIYTQHIHITTYLPINIRITISRVTSSGNHLY